MGFQTFTASTFRRTIAGHGLVFMVFAAPGCPPCEEIERTLTEISLDPWKGVDLPATSITMGKISVDEYPALADMHRVAKTPTLKVYQDGALVFEHVGTLPEFMLRSLIRTLGTA